MKTWRAYDNASESYFENYEQLRFAVVHRSFLRFLPEVGKACLDVGAGSGRDAAALAKRGYLVTAVEPSDQLRDLAQTHHKHDNIRWVNDSLPSLSVLQQVSARYSFILVSAVWMHLPQHTWREAFQTLCNLMEADGSIAISVRAGPDDLHRGMYAVDIDKLLLSAQAAGLAPQYRSRRTRDTLGRSGVEWHKFIFKKTKP